MRLFHCRGTDVHAWLGWWHLGRTAVVVRPRYTDPYTTVGLGGVQYLQQSQDYSASSCWRPSNFGYSWVADPSSSLDRPTRSPAPPCCQTPGHADLSPLVPVSLTLPGTRPACLGSCWVHTSSRCLWLNPFRLLGPLGRPVPTCTGVRLAPHSQLYLREESSSRSAPHSQLYLREELGFLWTRTDSCRISFWY